VFDWVADVVVRIPIRGKAQPTLDVRRPNEKQLGPCEGGTVVEVGRKAIQKFHEATQVGMVALLVGHDPTGGIIVIVDLMLREIWLKRNIKKNYQCEKKKLEIYHWTMAAARTNRRIDRRIDGRRPMANRENSPLSIN